MQMKNLYLILFILISAVLITTKVKAQIPNAGFEQWNQSEPINWMTSNLWFLKTVSPTDVAVSGSSAIKLTTLSMGELLMPATALSGANGSGFPVNQRYEQLGLYYKFNKTNNTAYLFISVGLFKNGQGIGGGVVDITTDAENYTALNIPIEYFDDQVPDSAVIMIMVADQFSDTSASGSFAIIDDLSFNKLADVKDGDIILSEYMLKQNYPNPFNPTTKISWQSPVNDWQTLKVYDILGNEVATLVDEYKPVGKYSIDFDASNLPSGVYLYQLRSGSNVNTRKMTLLK